MKVYMLIVTSEYWGISVCCGGIFSTREKAEKAWEKIKERGFAPHLTIKHKIKEFQIDETLGPELLATYWE